MNIDISNAYPAILLHNTKISSYSIHDAVEKFNGCKTKLDHRRVLRRGNRTEQVRILTKDRSSFLQRAPGPLPGRPIKYAPIPYNMEGHHKAGSQIGHLLEREAKRLCNAYIGKLGRKYSKSNSVDYVYVLLTTCLSRLCNILV